MKISIVSLGCVKNLVDSEMMCGCFLNANCEYVKEPKDADIIIVNTCGFILSSKKESLDTIFRLLSLDKPIFVTGCLVERYLDNLRKEIPEVSRFIPIRDYVHFKEIVNDALGFPLLNDDLNMKNRALSSEPNSAYLRISDGCDNRCSYCAIPLIRGNLKSRPMEEIYEEALLLAKKGIKELVLIAQNTTDYGKDGLGYNLVDLLKKLLTIKEFRFIRTLYLYPHDVSDELIDLFASEVRLTPYFDLPFQHVNDELLKAMNRRDKKIDIINLLDKIHAKIKHPFIRTTFIIGFPGETEEQFLELLDFIKHYRFTHLGAFVYSREEGTVSYDFKEQVNKKVAKDRLRRLLALQKQISKEINETYIGLKMDALVIKKMRKDTYLVRSGFNAPDDIDGKIYLHTNEHLELGEIVQIEIVNSASYDLEAKFISKT